MKVLSGWKWTDKMKDMFRHNYILDENRNPVMADLDTWCKWIEKAERHVGDEKVGPYRISTVFLGLDHNYHDYGQPILWETMIFRSPADENDELDQYSRTVAPDLWNKPKPCIRARLKR
jgi:hypothetical protein